ncbi:hypothetical protein [Nonomuraea turcica]|uniref:hypothetical protein n=1 Tax=Nonomuraea sp. G32 TaxID=3067274 RepID=UPI00273B40C2|nr:hypothetical protein [Nonomuraea sp. G32]MDP4509148.1 hypothetical protein [Nonomuraea sp. G32]
METIHGRNGLIDELVPGLVGLRFDGRRAEFTYLRRAPYIEIAGERGAGKTAVLKRLEAGYSQRLPLVYADLGKPDFGRPGLGAYTVDRVPNASPVTDLLYLLAHELGVKVKGFSKPMEFPRLLHGLLAITAWETTSPAELAAARARLHGMVSLPKKVPDPAAKLLAKVVGSVTAGLGVPAPLDDVVKALVEIAGEALFARGVRRDALGWWDQQTVRAGGDGLDQLCTLAMNFRARGSDRTKAQQHLAAALLEDAAAYYGWWRNQNRDPRPLMLLDNAHTELGEGFLDLLLHAQNAAAKNDRPARIVVLAASLQDAGDRPDIGSALPLLTWRERPDPASRDWLFRLKLARLTVNDIQAMLPEFQRDDGLAKLIERVSGGNARIADAFVRAAAHASSTDGGVKLEGLLDDVSLRDGRSATTGARLLEQLLPDSRALRHLIFYAPALDEPAAEHLSGRFPPDDGDGLPIAKAKKYLRATFWSDPRWPGLNGPFVRHRALRTLLIHELRTRKDEETWTALHDELRSFYAPQGFDKSASKAEYLHHTLALGDSATVIRTLHQLFDQLDAASWLKAVNLICAAPQPPAGATGRSEPDEPCLGCLGTGEDVHHVIEVLVRELWRQSAPLSVPDEERIGRIELQLLLLAGRRKSPAQAVFDAARRTWPERLRNWNQAPYLTIPAGDE